MKNVKTHGVVGDTPGGNTNAVGDVKARVHRLKVVRARGALDVELSDGALRSGTAKGLHGVLDVNGGGQPLPLERCCQALAF